MHFSFNLIEEPWIEVVEQGGTPRQVGLRQALVDARDFRELFDNSPLVMAATLRLLLALLHRVFGPKDRSDWRALWKAGCFDANALDAYFAKWSNRFDLFDKEHPFYQVAEEPQRPASIGALLYELFSATLFEHTLHDAGVTLSPAAAARTLLVAQMYGFGGRVSGPAYFTEGPHTRDILFFAAGDSLFETLMLNLIRYNKEYPRISGPRDCPAWEMDDPFKPARTEPFGYLDYLTWQNRRIRLIPELDGSGVVVRQMELNPGLPSPEDQKLDPYKLYRSSDKGLSALRFREDRDLWRDSDVLFRLNAEDSQAPAFLDELSHLVRQRVLSRAQTRRLMAFGLSAKPGQVVIYFHRGQHLPLPLAYLEDEALVGVLSRALELAEETRSRLWRASSTLINLFLAPNYGDGSETRPNPDDVQRLRDHLAIERHYWSQLETPFYHTLQAIAEQGTNALIPWVAILRSAAQNALHTAADTLERSPRGLKAQVRARQQLARELGALLKIQPGTIQKEEVT